MKKRILMLVGTVLLLLPLLTVQIWAAEPVLYQDTPRLVEDTFRYLDEIYLQQYPDLGLRFVYGTAPDQQFLADLADTITADCRTDREKAEAIHDWTMQNIAYSVNGSAFPMDVCRSGEGNCLSFALLMQTLLRLEGIPAVVGDGWRGDMETMGTNLFAMEGHAWCFAWVDSQWVLYDPLWLEDGITDRDYMAKNMYFEHVEFVTPVYDTAELPPHGAESFVVYYIDGRYRIYWDQQPSDIGNFTYMINNMEFLFTPCSSEYDGMYYMDGRSDSDLMLGELYRDGFVTYGEPENDNFLLLHYYYENGMHAAGTFVDFRGELLFADGLKLNKFYIPEGSYTISGGMPTVKTGYVGRVMEPCEGEGFIEDDFVVLWEAMEPEIATIDSEGVVTALGEGIALMKRELQDGDGTLYSLDYIRFKVSNEEELWVAPKFPHVVTYTWPAEALRVGDTFQLTASCATGTPVFSVSDPEVISITPDGLLTGLHWGSAEVILRVEETELRKAFEIRIPVEVAASHDPTPEVPAPPYDPSVPTEPSSPPDYVPSDPSMPTDFVDVTHEDYFAGAVNWAVGAGVTNGMGENRFAPELECIRAQVVTFLWRAMGCPEPENPESPFLDVQDPNAYYYKAVLWAVEQGITTGTGEGLFSPDQSCTRGQVVTFLWRAAGKPESVWNIGFSDVTGEEYYAEAVSWAVERAITQGMGMNRFEPDMTCTRAQIVTFLFRYMR